MKHKTLFRLLLKVVGVWLFVDGAGQLASYAANVLFFLTQQVVGGAWSQLWYSLFSLIGPLLKSCIGLYLFFSGEWIVNKAIPSNRPYCPECAYDLSGAVSNRCPECGMPFRPDEVRPGAAPDAPGDRPL